MVNRSIVQMLRYAWLMALLLFLINLGLLEDQERCIIGSPLSMASLEPLCKEGLSLLRTFTIRLGWPSKGSLTRLRRIYHH